MIDTQYEDLLKRVLTHGYLKDDRTGTGTMSLFGPQLRYDMADGFPLITTKRVFWRGVVEELLWFLEGSTNARALQRKDIHIWDAWAPEDGDLGPIYGAQWRSWRGHAGYVDQIARVIESIKTDPDGRRHIVSAWNVGELDKMALPPCHAFFQFYVRGHKLDLQLYQRSADMFLGVPFNIASYSLLLHMMAHETGLRPGEFVWTAGDAHVYSNHQDQVFEQLDRDPVPFPTLHIRRGSVAPTNLKGWTMDDFSLVGYNPAPSISAPVAV